MINGFVPAAMASDFDIGGNVNLEGAVNHYTDSRAVARESEYLCAQIASHSTAMSKEGIVDFESVVVFDVHVTPGGSDALLRRTAVAYVTVTFYCRYF